MTYLANIQQQCIFLTQVKKGKIVDVYSDT